MSGGGRRSSHTCLNPRSDDHTLLPSRVDLSSCVGRHLPPESAHRVLQTPSTFLELTCEMGSLMCEMLSQDVVERDPISGVNSQETMKGSVAWSVSRESSVGSQISILIDDATSCLYLLHASSIILKFRDLNRDSHRGAQASKLPSGRSLH